MAASSSRARVTPSAAWYTSMPSRPGRPSVPASLSCARVSFTGPSLHLPIHGETAGREAHRGQPPRAPRLPPRRPGRGRGRADRDRGEVASRGEDVPPASVRRGEPERGVARRRAHSGVPPGQPREPRSRAAAQAPAPPARDRPAVRPGAREGRDDRPDADVLQGRQGEGRARGRARQGAARQAARHRRPRREAADRARARAPPLVDREEVDDEDEGLVGCDDAVAGAARPVRERGRDGELPPAADAHAGDALIPARDHLALAEREAEGVAAVPRCVELLTGAKRDAGVVHRDLAAGRRLVAVAVDDVLDAEVERDVALWLLDRGPLEWHRETLATMVSNTHTGATWFRRGRSIRMSCKPRSPVGLVNPPAPIKCESS